MTVMLGAFASSMIRAGQATCVFLVLAVLSVLVAHVALAQEVVAMQPTYQGPPATPTITLWRDGSVVALIVVLIGVLIWRVSLIETWVRSQVRFHGLAAALCEDELEKRGVQVRPKQVEPHPPLQSFEEGDPWTVEADKAAPPPPPKPLNVQRLSPRDMAHKLTPRTRAKGNA